VGIPESGVNPLFAAIWGEPWELKVGEQRPQLPRELPGILGGGLRTCLTC
jgi:hypothetical protein